MARTDLLARANDLRSNRTPFVFATVVRALRPTSAKAGDCALVLPDGTVEGFVGGDCAESTVRLQGLRLLAAGQSALLRITPGAPSDAAGPQASAEGLITVGNPCLSGGTLDIFLEVMSPPMLVHVFGDSPIARAVTAVGAAMGWDMQPSTKPDMVIPPDTAAVVVASHGGDEERVLSQALRAGVRYVGLVASRPRGAAVIGSLDVDPRQRACLHSPAGLDIAAHGPGEIAVSILAEILKSRTVESGAGSAGSPPDPAPVTQQAADPVCGMTVAATAGSRQFQLAETTWYFCGPGCRDAFAADPGRYGA